MKKTLLFGFLLATLSMNVSAQKGFSLGIGPTIGLPVGDASDISSFVIGGEVQGEYKFNEGGSLVFTSGYSHFLGKDLGGVKLSYGAIPILAGARYYPSSKFFIGGQIGYGFFTGDASDGGFAYKPQVGFDASAAQIAVSYNGISNNGTIGWIGWSGVIKLNSRKAKK